MKQAQTAFIASPAETKVRWLSDVEVDFIRSFRCALRQATTGEEVKG